MIGVYSQYLTVVLYILIGVQLYNNGDKLEHCWTFFKNNVIFENFSWGKIARSAQLKFEY